MIAEREDEKTAADDDDAQTAAYLIGRQESNVIITGPREYQLELFERAKQENTIAVLPTGEEIHIVDQNTKTADGRRRRQDTDSGSPAQAHPGSRA